MKKIIFSLLIILSLGQVMQAQDAKTGMIEISKASQPCVIAQYAMPASIIEGAWKKKCTDAKLPSADKTKDGFKVYKGVVIPEITKDRIDVYVRIEDNKTSTTFYMLTSKGYDNFLKTETDAVAIDNTINYLNAFAKDATIFQYNLDLEKQQDVLKGLSRKESNAIRTGESLVKDKQRTESKISKNEIEMRAFNAEMEAQQKLLELTKTKTATIDGVDALKKEISKQESLVRKITKSYNNAVEDDATYKENLKKIEGKIVDNDQEQEKIKADLVTENAKLAEINEKLNALK